MKNRMPGYDLNDQVVYALPIKNIKKITKWPFRAKYVIEFEPNEYGDAVVNKYWIKTFNPQPGDYFIGFLSPNKICIKKFWFESAQLLLKKF